MTENFQFKILKKSKKSKARAAELHTAHGVIKTPCFMPVGTAASVKALSPEMVRDAHSQILLANTYHLSLRPGVELIKAHGGLHKFMNWDKPILTDSGGYQVFSLSKQRKITSEGVSFKSHIDGSTRFFSPKSVIDLQVGFNSDIMMVLDICTAYDATKKKTLSDMMITHKWAKESVEYWRKLKTQQWLFAIVQGGFHKELRQESADYLSQLNFPGYAIGGLSVGEPMDELHEYIAYTAPLIPEEKPKYVMGIGYPENLEVAIHNGIDMFDCVVPTRIARHGQFFLNKARINIKRKEFENDLSPLDEQCSCYACAHYSKAYIRHLWNAKELFAYTLLSIHNVQYLNTFVEGIRDKLLKEN